MNGQKYPKNIRIALKHRITKSRLLKNLDLLIPHIAILVGKLLINALLKSQVSDS